MERFAAVDDQYDPDAVEEWAFGYWDDVDAYERTKARREGEEPYFFVDGPPYTSGAAHMGTAWNKTLKDAYLRHLRMSGYDVTDRPGYDMHGLPIETKVEEELGFENKKDIEDFGIEAFIEECKRFANENLEAMTEDFESFGVWMDWDDPYKTVTPEYMEAAWWAFKRAHERGLVERGKRSINQCPRCETAIADAEVEYHEIESPSIYVKFPLKDREGSLVIWTTTPWTLPGHEFIGVHEDLTYQAVRAEKNGQSEVLYVAAECVEDVLRKGRYQDYEVVDELSGADMIGWEYEYPLADQVPDHAAFEGTLTVYHADYVEADRTGLVHSAPGHGPGDFERGQELGLEPRCPVGPDGTFTEQAGTYAGTFVRDANDDIIADLEAEGALLASGTHEHRYGKCWRCDTDIVFLATDQWFITVTDIKQELLENIDDSEWYPQWARDNRFRDFVEDSRDWNVSRQRYWGIPIPIWTPEGASPEEEATDMIVVGTREELAERVDQDVDPASVDLHKPTVDPLTITEDGTTYTRVPDVFDVWLDSSVATWGTLDYPEEQEAFEALWPADLIMEAHDQTRGWFWSQLGMGTAAFGEIPYDRVLMHGHALAEDGRKMSKSLGNIVAPEEAIERHGADAMRVFLLAQTPQGDDMRFSWDEMAEMQRRLNILWNVFRFPLPYMRLDGFDPEATTVEDVPLETVDEWVLSRLEATKRDMDEAWEAFEQHEALDALLTFVVEDLSRFYVQVVRERMWEEADSDAKTAAYATMYHVLDETVALLAPFAPFITERIYAHLSGDAEFVSVHMRDWPAPAPDRRNPALENQVAVVRAAEEAGANARQQAERKRRWPVTRVVVDADEERVEDALAARGNLLTERLNARTLEVVPAGERWGELTYGAEADMSVLGPAFGDDAGAVMAALNEARVEEASLEALKAGVAEATGEAVDLTDEMVDYVEHAPENVVGVDFDGGTVYVDVTLTEDIESEGYAREVIRRVQEMRKELDLDVEEEIRVSLSIGDDRIADLVREREALIAEEVRAAAFGDVEDGHRREWTVEGVPVELAIEPLAGATA